MFYKKLRINGVEYPLAVNITGEGAPTSETEAEVGMFYMDKTDGTVYKLTPDGWKPINVDPVQTTGNSETSVMSQKAVTDKLNEKANITALDKKADGIEVDLLEKRVANLEGATLEFTEDSTVAYEKVVPADSSKYALVNKVGGISYKTRNLIPFPYDYEAGYSVTKSGTTFTIQEDGGISVVGTPTTSVVFPFFYDDDKILNLRQGEQYTIGGVNVVHATAHITPLDEIKSTAWLDSAAPSTTTRELPEGYRLYRFCVYVPNGETVNEVVYPMLVEGSEAPTKYEPFFKGLRDTKVEELRSVGANLLKYPYDETIKTRAGITFTDNSDGSVTLNGTNDGTGHSTFRISLLSPKPIHLTAGKYIGSTGNAKVTMTAYNGTTYYPCIPGFTLNTEEDFNIYIQVPKGEKTTFSNTVVYPMLNRGSTAAPYKPYRADAVDTFPISAELRAFLEQYGYGRGVNDNWHSYIDFERKVYVHKPTHRQVLDGTENWYSRMTVDDETYALYVELDVAGHTYDYGVVGDLICNKYRTQYYDGADEYEVGIGINGSKLSIYDLAYNDGNVDAWKAHLAQDPLVIEYATGEPNEIDISAYLTDDNFIEVEGGGTITAVNEYDQDAPSTISFVSAIGG